MLEEVQMPGFTPTPPPARRPGQTPSAAPGAWTTPESQLPSLPVRTTLPSAPGSPSAQNVRRVDILRDDPAKADVRALLAENRDLLYPGPGSGAAGLTPPFLKDSSVTFWTVREGGILLGCGALKELPGVPGGAAGEYGEITSMRTTAAARGFGVGKLLLQQIITNARARGYVALLLETGTQEFFASSRRLYQRHGFVPCAPFGDYRADPRSVFMRLDLQAPAVPTDAGIHDPAPAGADTDTPAPTQVRPPLSPPGTLTAILAAQRALASKPLKR
ncbi:MULTISPECIES: GNAT family N-acetyltransferase [unclassified Arthrobacter]|uniref:GNAT family N-acetyltransferase n=1 Tax=unclassified Arthrobacter TaxID=235627 RepID=UPI002F3E790A